MRGACARAGLADRYFYESFADREALLVAIAESVRDETIAVILNSGAAPGERPYLEWLRAALTAMVEHIDQNPGSAQIFFGDHGGSEILESLRRDTISAVVELFLDLARPRLSPTATQDELRLTFLLGIGGFVEAVTARRAGNLDMASEALVENLVGVARRLADGLIDLS